MAQLENDEVLVSNTPDPGKDNPAEPHGSVAQAIAEYQQGDASRLGELVFGFHAQLVNKARAALMKAPSLRSVTDSEGAVSSAMGSYWKAVKDGKHRGMKHSSELLGLLIKIVECKVAHQIRDNTTQKAGGGRVRNEPDTGLDAEGREPSPSEAALEKEQQVQASEALQRWRNYMSDKGLLEVAELVLEGRTYKEIAGALEIGENKARRLMTLVNALTRAFVEERSTEN
jgi:DNA-directed RNA polymerase specialized sigma24 family protein